MAESQQSEAELEEFSGKVCLFLKGELDEGTFKKRRLQQGMYGIRGSRSFMARVKLPGGAATPAQLRTIAEVVDGYSNGKAHVTTRQDIQIYHLEPERVAGALRALAAAGLTSREACGNSVRNVTACPLAGFCPLEEFDVRPTVESIFRHYLRNPGTQALPRKFKVAVSGCSRDCALAGINDLGLIARRIDGRGTYEVRAGGGLGVWPQAAQVLREFAPPEEVLPLCDAVLAIFNRMGERENRSAARLKYLIRKIGFGRFTAEVEKELAIQNPKSEIQYQKSPSSSDGCGAPDFLFGNGPFRLKDGSYGLQITLPVGDITSAQLRAVAEAAESSGAAVRTTPWQSILLVGIPEMGVRQTTAVLSSSFPAAGDDAPRCVSCPGAETCQIGLTRSRSAALQLIADFGLRILDCGIKFPIRIHFSGCPNGCGQHMLADIGFQGGAKRVGEREAPLYTLFIGGSVSPLRFGRPVGKVPARAVPAAVRALLDWYRAARRGKETVSCFLGRADAGEARIRLALLMEVPDSDEYFVDAGTTGPFTTKGRGAGECAQ